MQQQDLNTLIFASANSHKAQEIQAAFVGNARIMLPTELGYHFEVEETGTTLKENAALKAEAASVLTGMPAFADDTGLFCDALNGAPGVHTARFAAMNAYEGSNNELLLERLKGQETRSARFISVFCLRLKHETLYFKGVLEGRISELVAGSGGFGYDPVFIPQGFSQTLAELPIEVKIAISHRSQALLAMQRWIKAYQSYHG